MKVLTIEGNIPDGIQNEAGITTTYGQKRDTIGKEAIQQAARSEVKLSA